MPPMPIYLKEDDNPTVNTFDLLGTNSVSLPPSTLPGGDIIALRGHTIFYSVGDPTNQVVAFDAQTVLVTTNLNPAVILLETNLNFQLGTPPPLYYRYESGTSMSAAGISGMLALIQQFFQQQLGVGISPALMKALLINGARSLGTPYDFQVASLINYQGWGLPAIGNSLPLALTNLTGSNDVADLAKMPLQFIDQSPTNALATGQSRTWSLNLSPAAQTVPLRVTLVWTDPPGNPTAGVKLVNNLALVVTNNGIFFGNDIPAGATFNEAWDPGTNNPPSWDMVNNVQNVFLAPPLGSNCTITVYGLRVNVNAVTAHTNGVVQDFALVMSSDVGGATFTNSLTLTNSAVVTSNILTATGTLTNGVPLLNQRVGGNSQYAPGTNGVTNQWNFYVYTNTAFLTNSFFTNVAFVTFAPPELGVPREGANQEANPPNATRPEADIDLYVSFDPTLTNLNPAAIAGANKSVGRTGTEKVLFTNQQTAGPYYIGVRSQDQQGAQFNLVGVATDQPFNQNQGTGPYPLTILGSFPVNIPDGSPSPARRGDHYWPDHRFEFGPNRIIVPDQRHHASELFGPDRRAESWPEVRGAQQPQTVRQSQRWLGNAHLRRQRRGEMYWVRLTAWELSSEHRMARADLCQDQRRPGQSDHVRGRPGGRWGLAVFDGGRCAWLHRFGEQSGDRC